MTLFNNSSDDDSSTYLLTYKGTAVSDAPATDRVFVLQVGGFPDDPGDDAAVLVRGAANLGG